MQVMLARLLALFALVLMPFGMGAGAAAAQPAPHHSATAASHCPDPASDNGATDQTANCTMTCSAVAASGFIAPPPPVAVAPPHPRPLAPRGSGLHPEAAIPPPKRA